jgi:hypothetical protein
MKGRPKRKASGVLADHKPADRTCLGCGKAFASQGPGNRFCLKCGGAAEVSRCEANPASDMRGKR